MQISVVETPETKGIWIVPVTGPVTEDPVLELADQQLDGALSRAATAAQFENKAGESLVVAAPGDKDDLVVLLAAMGDTKSTEPQQFAGMGGKFAALAARYGREMSVFSDGIFSKVADQSRAAAQLGIGAALRGYEFSAYRTRTKKDSRFIDNLVIVSSEGNLTIDTAMVTATVGGVSLARDLVSEPPNVLHPESFAERCLALRELGVEVAILDESQMAEMGMGSLLGVGQGSIRGSRLATMHWKGGGEADAPVALVGKGVTFDTGGISLKPGQGMEDMKFDMGGAAAVVGAMHTLAARKASANVVGLIGLVENMPDGNAQRPSDIVTSMSGQTIEILNTDAEGRLVLADVLTYAQRKFKPSTVIDLATLTGAIIISLAHEFAGMFTKDDELATDLAAAGTASSELLWRMPLTHAHDEMIKSDIADMKNIGGRDGGSSSAAAFLARFIEEGVRWAHLDIAGTAWTKKDLDDCPKGATGYGVRLLDEYIRRYAEQGSA